LALVYRATGAEGSGAEDLPLSEAVKRFSFAQAN
jgi:hypothetical protein